ncbi:MAG TPA: TonB family protein [Pyrinomonadaceae bacterium]|nr:TonB family protein [Pyrinomonadaceae bacterium]
MSSFCLFYPSVRVSLPTIFLLLTVTASAAAQSSVPQTETTGTDPVMTRIERARALAAAHQLGSAARELESVRAAVNDASVRNITTLMLISIYLEEGNYVRAVALLDEAFHQRKTQKDNAVRTYFALAGQAINGVRTRLARYRSFGINVNGSLPSEAMQDLDQMRFLLERLAAQATEATNENGRAYDAWALKEDVLGLRATLARDLEDREKWEGEYTAAREKLASRQIQIASIGRPPVLDAVTSKLPNPFSGIQQTTSPESKTAAPAPANTAPPLATPQSSPNATAVQPQPTPSPSAPAPPSDDKDVNTIRTGSLSGRERKRVTPIYPVTAKTAGVAGVVRVFVLVDEEGRVTVTGSEGPALLKQAAEDAARKWSFGPTMVNNRVVRVSGYIDFEFTR